MKPEAARRWPGPSILAGIIVSLAVGAVVLAVLIVAPGLGRLSAPLLDLSGTWELCSTGERLTTDCAWLSAPVPSDVPAELRSHLPGWLIYRKTFTAPAACLAQSANCALLLGEVGDAVESRLNGITIGRRGNFPPAPHYARHYPVLFDLSRDVLKAGEQANELVLIVYAMKKHQTGVRRGPVAIFPGMAGLRIAQSRITLSILVPILGAAILFIISVITSFSSFWRNRTDAKLNYYVLYCLAASIFLFSFSEVPREYIPIWVAGHLHFALRLLCDWAYFEMVRAFYDFGEQLRRWLRSLYLLAIAAFVIGLLVQVFLVGVRNGAGFDSAYTMTRLCFPLLLLPHVLGLAGAILERNKPGAKLFITLFAVLVILQIWDILVFNGFITGTYTVKIYALILGLVFGYGFLEKSRQDHSRALLEQEQAQQMGRIHEATLEIAHDLRTPLASFKMACEELTAHPADPALLESTLRSFTDQADRIFQMTDSILRSSKELSGELRLQRIQVDLGEFLVAVVEEFRRHSTAAHMTVSHVVPSKPVLALIDPLQFRRALDNLLLNAAEACLRQTDAQLSVTLRPAGVLHPFIELTVSDNGPGLPELVQKSLFRVFVTSGKEHGIGLGLAATKRLIEAHGGTIEHVASNRRGATFRIRLPAGLAPV